MRPFLGLLILSLALPAAAAEVPHVSNPAEPRDGRVVALRQGVVAGHL